MQDHSAQIKGLLVAALLISGYGQTTLATTLNSLLTAGLFFVLVGYVGHYGCYYSLVLRSS